jgi:hypothetical protein
MTVLRPVRKEMGVLFWTMHWYSRSEISFRVTESRCAYSLILGTSCRDGSVSCILRKIMLRFISWIMTRMLYRTSDTSTFMQKVCICKAIVSFQTPEFSTVKRYRYFYAKNFESAKWLYRFKPQNFLRWSDTSTFMPKNLNRQSDCTVSNPRIF